MNAPGHLPLNSSAEIHRSPDDWLAALADPLLAQSAVDRTCAWGLVTEGESSRRRQEPTLTTAKEVRR